MTTLLDLPELARRGQRAGLNRSGLVSRQETHGPLLEDLHGWLLSNCASIYFAHYLRGGLGHWTRRWEYPFILTQLSAWLVSRDAPEASAELFDNACGVNATGFLLASAGHSVFGTDLNDAPSAEGDLPAQAWEHADTKAVRGSMRFQAADSLHLPFEANRFDASYSISSLEHMPDPLQAIREMIRVTKSGGLIAFTMDVAPYDGSLHAESNVNRSNFYAIQELLSESATFFAPPRFVFPNDALSWHHDCRRSHGLRAAAGRVVRQLRNEPSVIDFNIFGGAYLKR